MGTWTRLVNGLSLIAKEAVKRSEVLDNARAGDLETLISSAVKKAVVTATDASGLTKGKVREFSIPATSYAPDESDVAITTQQVSENAIELEQVSVPERVQDSNAQQSASASESEDSGGNVDVVVKRRKPRERRVPSTPFSRALGFVFHVRSSFRGDISMAEALIFLFSFLILHMKVCWIRGWYCMGNDSGICEEDRLWDA